MTLTKYNLLNLISSMTPDDFQTFSDLAQNFDGIENNQLQSYFLSLKNEGYVVSSGKTAEDGYILHNYQITEKGKEYLLEKKAFHRNNIFTFIAAITGIISAAIGLISLLLQWN